jgi:hypothetical protein
MTKTALQTAKTKAAFQWDPNNDQTYNLDQDLSLPGPASNFSKATGKSFTMDSPLQTLTLQITPLGQGTNTTWGDGAGTAPTTINVERGTFIYDGRNGGATLLFLGNLDFGYLETTIAVKNDAQFVVKSSDLNNGVGIQSDGSLNFAIEGTAVADVNCIFIGLPSEETFSVNISVADMAQMSVACSTGFSLINGTVNVSSSPATGHSLNWIATHTGVDESLLLVKTFMEFSAASSGLLRCPVLALTDTRIATLDTAACFFEFDSIAPTAGSQFILGPGTAKMQFAPYTAGKYPFDFIGKTYPEGLFEIKSAGTVNGGAFVIRGSVFDANAIVTRGHVAIDGEVQRDFRRLSSKQDTTGYITVKQIA